MTGSRHLWYQPMVVMAFHALRPLRHFQGPVTLCPPLSIHLRSARPSPSADQLCFVDFVLFDRLTVWPLISFFTWDKNWEVSWKVIAFYTAGTNFCWRNSKSKGIQRSPPLSLDCLDRLDSPGFTDSRDSPGRQPRQPCRSCPGPRSRPSQHQD